MFRERELLFSAIPHADESFIGYLLRLTEVNRYETLSWLLHLAQINYVGFKFPLTWNGSLDVSVLKRLTGVDETTLTSLLYVPMRSSERQLIADYLVFGNPVPHHMIRLKHPKICPACLRDSNYARIIWELAPVTVCPSHEWELVAYGLLNPVRGPIVDGCSDWKFHEKEVKNLLQQIKRKVCSKEIVKNINTISFLMAFRRLRNTRVLIGQFIKDIIASKIYPLAVSSKPGLDAFQFSTKQIAEYANNRLRVRQ